MGLWMGPGGRWIGVGGPGKPLAAKGGPVGPGSCEHSGSKSESGPDRRTRAYVLFRATPPHRSLVLFQPQRHLLGDLLHGHAGHGAAGHLDVLQHRHELGPDGGEEREGET